MSRAPAPVAGGAAAGPGRAEPTPLDLAAAPVLERLTEVVFQTDVAGNWSYLNPAWTRLTGFPVAETLGTSFLGYVHPDEREHTIALFMAVVAGGADHCHHEARYRTASGGYVWVELRATLLRNEGGELVGNSGTILDIGERRRAAEMIHEHLELLELVAAGGRLEDLPVGVALYGPDLTLRRASPVVERLLGMSMRPGDTIQKVYDLLDAGDDRSRRVAGAWGPVATAVSTGRPQYGQLQVVAPADGRVRVLHVSVVPMPAAGTEPSLAMVMHDVTDVRRAERQQAAVATLGQRGLAGSSLPALMHEAADLVTATVEADYCEVLELLGPDEGLLARAAVGWPEGMRALGVVTADVPGGGVIGRTLATNAPVVVEGRGDGEVPVEPWLQQQGISSSLSVVISGSGGPFGVLAAHSRSRRTFTADEVNFVTAIANVLAAAIERGRVEDATRHLALHDPLTGLANRVLLHDRLEQALRTRRRGGSGVALLLMDLDRFKDVNDTLGHDVGDRLLRHVAARLADAVRDADTVARLGGDEFAVVLPTVGDLAGAVALATKLRAVVQEPVEIGGMHLHADASVGVVVAPAHGEEPILLLRRADVAMYRAKQLQGGVATYSAESDQNRPERLEMVGALRRALDDDQLVLHYQPKIDLMSGRVTAVEALVRWQHPTRGLLPPDFFIPLAEQTGLISQLTDRVIAMALRQARLWREAGAPLSVAVNVSARVLHDPGFVPSVLAQLHAQDLPPSVLELELTESTMMSSPGVALDVIDRLRRAGSRISVDDFGTGYSSLAYLRNLPVHELKIDRSFIRDVASDSRDAAMVRSIIDLGHNLGLRVVAEGVESEEACLLLRELGCDEGQGYFFARPSETGALDAPRTR